MLAARPLVAASGGRLIVQSTPGLPSGFFWELASDTPPGWDRIVIRSDEVPSIDPAFIERERREMSDELFRNEYLAEFSLGHAPPGIALFDPADLEQRSDIPAVPGSVWRSRS